MVEGGQLLVALPVGAAREAFRNKRVRGGNVVEHAVEHDFDAAAVALGHEPVEVVVGAEARVDAVVIERVITVADGFKDGAEQQAVAAELDEVIQPRL